MPYYEAEVYTLETYHETVYVRAKNLNCAMEKIAEGNYYTCRRRHQQTIELVIEDVRVRRPPAGVPKSREKRGLASKG